jgi:hypothetical protein
MAAAIIPSRGKRRVIKSFFRNRKRMAEIKMAKAYPDSQSHVGNRPSGKWIWDISFSL